MLFFALFIAAVFAQCQPIIHFRGGFIDISGATGNYPTGNNARTISAAYYVPASNSFTVLEDRAVLSFDSDPGCSTSSEFSMCPANAVLACCNQGDNYFDPAGVYTVKDRWVHLLMTYDGAGHLRTYIDGIRIPLTFNLTFNTAVECVKLGQRCTTGAVYTGYATNIAIWDYPMVESEVYGVYCGIYPQLGLLSFYTGHTVGGKLIDNVTTTGNDGTFNGSVSTFVPTGAECYNPFCPGVPGSPIIESVNPNPVAQGSEQCYCCDANSLFSSSLALVILSFILVLVAM
jgi:hypothetical protein